MFFFVEFMSSIKIKNTHFDKLEKEDFLSLICAAAALRKEGHLKALLEKSKLFGIKEKPLYESLLQNYLFAGYPSAMISLKILKEYYPKLESVLHDSWDLNKYKERGTKNCKKIYGRKFDKLISNEKSFSPELSDWLLLESYGKVMGRKSLSLKQRELNNVSVLTALKFEDQLYNSWKYAKNYISNLTKKTIPNFKVGLHFNQKLGIYEGDSLGIALTLSFIFELEEDNEWADAIEHLLKHMDNQQNKVQELIATMLAKRDQWLRHIIHPDNPGLERKNLEEKKKKETA